MTETKSIILNTAWQERANLFLASVKEDLPTSCTVNITHWDHFVGVVRQMIETDAAYGGKYGLLDDLKKQLGYLIQWGDQEGEEYMTELYPDGGGGMLPGPPGFGWIWYYRYHGEEKWRNYMNGTLLFHNGSGMSDGTFSVELNPKPGPHWASHS